MATTSQITRRNVMFGPVQVLLLGALLVGGAVLALPLQLMMGGAGAGRVATGVHPVGLALWGVEVLGYFAVAWILSQRQVRAGVIGLVIGLVTRLFMSGLIALLLSSVMNQSPGVLVRALDGQLWGHHLLALLATIAILVVSCGKWLAAGAPFPSGGALPEAAPTKGQFAFSGGQRRAGTLDPGIVARSGHRAAQQRFAPPEGFMPVAPRDDVYGMVTIPSSVVFESLPEAKNHLDSEQAVRVRLAFIIPQLRRGTVWVTWQQLTASPLAEDGKAAPAGPDAGLRDCWIRIPARHYVEQVPGEYFKAAKMTPAWMKLAEVEQEAQFRAEELVR